MSKVAPWWMYVISYPIVCRVRQAFRDAFGYGRYGGAQPKGLHRLAIGIRDLPGNLWREVTCLPVTAWFSQAKEDAVHAQRLG